MPPLHTPNINYEMVSLYYLYKQLTVCKIKSLNFLFVECNSSLFDPKIHVIEAMAIIKTDENVSWMKLPHVLSIVPLNFKAPYCTYTHTSKF